MCLIAARRKQPLQVVNLIRMLTSCALGISSSQPSTAQLEWLDILAGKFFKRASTALRPPEDSDLDRAILGKPAQSMAHYKLSTYKGLSGQHVALCRRKVVSCASPSPLTQIASRSVRKVGPVALPGKHDGIVGILGGGSTVAVPAISAHGANANVVEEHKSEQQLLPSLKFDGRLAVVWFRTDLRLDDNPVLAEASTLIKQGKADAVMPIYFLDPRNFGTTRYGNLKTGPFRTKFLLESLQDLKQALQNIGSDILIVVGKPEEELPRLLASSASCIVLTERQITEEEINVNEGLKKVLPKTCKFRELWGYSLYHISDIPFDTEFSDLPNTFTPFKEKVERNCKVRELLPPPAKGKLPLPPDVFGIDFFPKWKDIPYEGDVPMPEGDKRSAFTLKGGEGVALARLQYYLWDSDLISKYFQIRNGMLGGDYSTKLAAHLAHGCISPRRIYHEVSKYEGERSKSKSTYWVKFELTWRDFYHFFAIKHGNNIFKSSGLLRDRPDWNNDPDALRRWKDGETGWPLVDANMRELRQTGFMSNRGRQNVASFLALDLNLDWRAGADYFESLLVDYDVTSNWGNWVAAAGLTGGRVNKFNIVKQSNDYDSGGQYVRTWIPELAKIQGKKVHEPWLLPRGDRQEEEVRDYPDRLPTRGGNKYATGRESFSNKKDSKRSGMSKGTKKIGAQLRGSKGYKNKR